jgi:hypothetical protein
MHEVPGTLTLLLSTRNNRVILLYPICQKLFDKNNFKNNSRYAY